MTTRRDPISVREDISNQLQGKNIAMTGTGPRVRPILAQALTDCNANCLRHMTKKADLLIYDSLNERVNRDNIRKAIKYGTPKKHYSDIFSEPQ